MNAFTEIIFCTLNITKHVDFPQRALSRTQNTLCADHLKQFYLLLFLLVLFNIPSNEIQTCYESSIWQIYDMCADCRMHAIIMQIIAFDICIFTCLSIFIVVVKFLITFKIKQKNQSMSIWSKIHFLINMTGDYARSCTIKVNNGTLCTLPSFLF